MPSERKKLLKKKKSEARGQPVLSLFNLKEDIGETTNVIDQHPEIAQRLKAMLDEFEEEMGQNRREADKGDVPIKNSVK